MIINGTFNKYLISKVRDSLSVCLVAGWLLQPPPAPCVASEVQHSTTASGSKDLRTKCPCQLLQAACDLPGNCFVRLNINQLLSVLPIHSHLGRGGLAACSCSCYLLVKHVFCPRGEAVRNFLPMNIVMQHDRLHY